MEQASDGAPVLFWCAEETRKPFVGKRHIRLRLAIVGWQYAVLYISPGFPKQRREMLGFGGRL